MKAEMEIEMHTCATEGCGVSFWLSEKYIERRRRDLRAFYCPNGHSLIYKGESDEARIQRLEREKLNAEVSSRNKDFEIEAMFKKNQRLEKNLKKCKNNKKKKV